MVYSAFHKSRNHWVYLTLEKSQASIWRHICPAGQGHRPRLPVFLVSVHQLPLLKPQRNLCITPRHSRAPSPCSTPRSQGQAPTIFHGNTFLPYLRALQLTCSRAAVPGTPSQLPHKTLSSHILTSDSLQTNPYHPTQDSSRFTSKLKAPKMTISGVILPFASQQRAALRKSWCAWSSERTRHTCHELL